MRVAVAAEGGRRIALRIEVDEQGLGAALGDAGGKVDRGGRLPDPALLVGDCVDQAHQTNIPRFALMAAD